MQIRLLEAAGARKCLGRTEVVGKRERTGRIWKLKGVGRREVSVGDRG